MKQTPLEIQVILDKGKAEEIAAYISRRNKEHPTDHATLSRVCQRFRINQTDVKRIIASVDYLHLSDMAYRPAAPGATWGEKMTAAWHPQIWEDAPEGKKLILVIEAVT